jgi:hypothetical protein
MWYRHIGPSLVQLPDLGPCFISTCEPMKKIITLLGLSLTLGGLAAGQVFAASTDIVPAGSTLLDSFAVLARSDAFGAENTPEDFLGEMLYTRSQLAGLLEHLLQDDAAKLDIIQKNSGTNSALYAAIQSLKPELKTDGVDLSESDTTPAAGNTLSGYVQPELRVRAGGDSKPGTGVLGVYRVTALGNLRPNLRYVVSASNWAQDGRRVFTNDIGTHDFSSLNEAYLELDGGRGLTVSLGRMNNRWGPGMLGATMLGDNAPALDQIQLAFPFSLGVRFGQNYRFTQMVSTFKANGTRDYLAARRIEYTFSPQWSADFQEAFLSDRSWSLQFLPFPDYYTAKNAHIPILGLREKYLDQDYKAAYNLTASYRTPDDGLRLYGQFMLHDLRSPGANSGVTPRKAAYLVGGSVRPVGGTRLTLEYTRDDPSTYSSRNVGTQWQEGQYDELALPGGPNATELYGRIDQKVGTKLSLSLEGRDRRRHDLSFPAPTARDLAATASYKLDSHSGVRLTFHDYRQDIFPIDPSVPLPTTFQPTNTEGNYGQTLRIKQLDVAYQFSF